MEIMNYLNGTLDEVSSSEDLKRLARLVRTTTSGTHNQRRAVANAGDGSSDLAESPIKIIRRICEDEGTLYRVTRHEGTEAEDQRVPFVPSQLRQSLMTAFHDNMGHANSQRVRIAIQQRYYWPKMAMLRQRRRAHRGIRFLKPNRPKQAGVIRPLKRIHFRSRRSTPIRYGSTATRTVA